jgi:16S rRNA (cytidine1402-2'-O)-methyltransferase
MSEASTLHVVSTPIGNLADFSERGKQTLTEVDLIACEDTRRTQKLLSHFDIHTPIESYHGDSSAKKRENIIDTLKAGKEAALVTDAGTPAVSDPGMRLVKRAHEEDIEVVSVPGPSAVTAALSAAGIKGHAFTFLGYAPRKNRKDFMQSIKEAPRTSIFFASPHRVTQTLAVLADTLEENRTVAVCREITKRFESIVRGTPNKVQEHFENNPDKVRGEFVTVVANKDY